MWNVLFVVGKATPSLCNFVYEATDDTHASVLSNELTGDVKARSVRGRALADGSVVSHAKQIRWIMIAVICRGADAIIHLVRLLDSLVEAAEGWVMKSKMPRNNDDVSLALLPMIAATVVYEAVARDCTPMGWGLNGGTDSSERVTVADIGSRS